MNEMEINLLICMVLIVMIDSISNGMDETFIYIILSIMIMIPFAILIYFVIKYQCKKYRKNTKKNDDQKSDFEMLEDCDKETELSINLKQYFSKPLLNDNMTMYDSVATNTMNESQ